MDYSELYQKLDEVISKAKETWQSDNVQSRISWAKQTARNLVDEYPIGTISGALLIGYIVGKLLSNDDE